MTTKIAIMLFAGGIAFWLWKQKEWQLGEPLRKLWEMEADRIAGLQSWCEMRNAENAGAAGLVGFAVGWMEKFVGFTSRGRLADLMTPDGKEQCGINYYSSAA